MNIDDNRALLAAALKRISDGDHRALQTVYRLTSAKLFGVAIRILGERSEAEDVLQEVYLTVWRKAVAFDQQRASPMTWLIAITRNRAIDRLRASLMSRRMEPIDVAAELADETIGVDGAIERSQEHQRLHHCLDSLAEHEQAALRAAFFDGNTYDELATRMKVPPGTMKSWIRRAMIKLRTCLDR